MRVMFLGAGAFGVPTLASLARPGGRHGVVGIITQPDRPAGRGMTLTPSPVGQWAAERAAGVPLLKVENVNEPSALQEIRRLAGPGGELGVDAWVVIAFGQKLSPPLLTGVAAMNLHASLLPRWRGAAPINAAVLAGDAETGNTVITLADRMDAGLILGQSRRVIEPSQTAGELHDLLSADGPALVERVLDEVAERGFANLGRAQDEALVTKAGKLSRADGWIDFADGAEACRRRVHGLTPWPGVSVRWGELVLKVLRVAADDRAAAGGASGGPGAEPGTVIDPQAGLVACGSGPALRMLEVQPAGSRAMSFAEFARGRRLSAGERLVGGRPS
jgi:methionyl-tRNA formyltransferase